MPPNPNHRHCYLLKGQPNKLFSAFLTLCAPLQSILICAQDASSYKNLTVQTSPKQNIRVINFQQAKAELGQTHQAVLLDVTQGISPSALAILAGTVVGNGILAIALPEDDWLILEDKAMEHYLPWPLKTIDVHSYFKAYCLNQLVDENSPFMPVDLKQVTPVAAIDERESGFSLTSSQHDVQKALLNQLRGPINHVLIAPRGRGKSTLLGDTIAHWVMAGKQVAVTGPNSHALQPLKKRYDTVMQMNGQETPLPFIAPDALLEEQQTFTEPFDHLVVDEAAMIPVPLLMSLLQKAKHCIFSTTDFGYEGAGKGFGLRFCQHLSQQSKPFESLTLQEPIRWGKDDPLENWVNQLLFLAPPLPRYIHDDISPTTPVSHCAIKNSDWLENQPLLSKAFSLLVNAHYQTSPDNLRWVMDNPAVTTWLAQTTDNNLKSVAIITSEGPLPHELSQAVLEGTRRPRGHLIPQSLLAHEGHVDAGEFHYWRISRIATDAEAQRQGHASHLLQHIEAQAQQQNIDFLSTSFAVTLDTLAFWQKNGYICVRLGTSKDQASGSYSVMMLKPLHTLARDIALRWHHYYLINLAINLPRDYSDIEKNVARKLQQTIFDTGPVTSEQLATKDTNDLRLFVQQHRPYFTIRAQLTRFIKQAMKDEKLTKGDKEYSLLKAIITQTEVNFAQYGLSSKKQVEKHLKHVVGKLLTHT